MEERLLLWVYAISAPYVLALWLRRRKAISVRLPITMVLIAGASAAGLMWPEHLTPAFWSATVLFLLLMVLPGVLVRFGRRAARSNRFRRARLLCGAANALLPARSLQYERDLYRALESGGGGMEAPWPPPPPALRWREIPATVSVILAVLAYYAVSTIVGSSGSTLTLLDLGANFGPLVKGGEPYRLLTAMFLHVGLLHLVMNCGAIWILGRWIEPVLGPGRLLLVYLLGGGLGNIASILWYGAVPSAGASGGAMALVGAATVVYLRRPATPAAKQRLELLVLMIGATLLLGYLMQGLIDNGAHMGGLAAGLVLGFLFVRVRPSPRLVAGAVGALILLLAVSFAGLFAGYRNWRRPVEFTADDFTLMRPAVFGSPESGPEWRFPGAPIGDFSVIIEYGELSPHGLARTRLDEIESTIRDNDPDSPTGREAPALRKDRRRCWHGSLTQGSGPEGVRYDVFVLRSTRPVAAVLTFSTGDDEADLRRELISGVLDSFEFR